MERVVEAVMGAQKLVPAVRAPGAVGERGFSWHLLSGVNGERGPAALATQHVSVNVDPSDRYVQSVPGTERYRLRPDESGYDNLVLTGDWTDSGMNAGCIEAAVVSGLGGGERRVRPAPFPPHPRLLHPLSDLLSGPGWR